MSSIFISRDSKSEYEIYKLLTYLNTSFKPHLDKQVDLANYAKKLNKKAIILYLNNENESFGILAYYLKNKVCFITSICIHECYQGHGYGKQYFDYLLDDLKLKSIDEINLEVHGDNKKAVKFYKKYGFSMDEYLEDGKIFARKIL
jgi:ribosomal protein S18 acetylase RimI-like enzyme